MANDPTIAAIRFGAGLSPVSGAQADAAALMAELAAPDAQIAAFPVMPSTEVWSQALAVKALRRARQQNEPGAVARVKAARAAVAEREVAGLVSFMQRGVAAPIGFRERLQAFWANHFTVVNKTGTYPSGPAAFADEALRPNLTASFATMLRAVVTHPMMLVYLDQVSSVGPKSVFGQRTGKGLNENLGRELMELHTLGVGAPYTQTDVRQLAKLLTGLGFDPKTGFVFRANWAEPGPKTVLGKTYDGPPRLETIYAALDDIAVRPETAHHLCLKLATHFVADTPDADLVQHMTAAYSASGGELGKVYAAMLDHPAAWALPYQKVRLPYDYLVAGLRALGVAPQTLSDLSPHDQRKLILGPLQLMGQPFEKQPEPNGWPEAAQAWVQPQMLAARIQWAMAVPAAVMPDLPDPRDFVRTALADAAGPALVTAAAQAETRRAGVGIILASSDFNRR
ncbi:MAG: DUF1800 family protein [Rhodobacteraceae bacterium]|nr:DUF1800 family protein [Paracoccaceae bacterium]